MVPERPIKPVWTSANYLHYVGLVIGVVSVLAVLDALEQDHGRWGLLGWSLLALGVLGALASWARGRGEPVVAGLLATIAVIVFGLFAGTLLEILGLLPEPEEGPGLTAFRASFFNEGLQIGLILLELAVIGAALYARSRFRFPLLTLVAAVTLWYGTMDLFEGVLGGGDTATALLAVAVGLGFLAAARARDAGDHHPYAFWLHVVAGLSIAGAVLWWWNDEPWEWLLVLLVSLAYIWTATVTRRSSWAVLGGLGVFASATYFVERWFGFGDLIPFLPVEARDVDEVGRPLVYAGVAAVFFLLGVLAERRDREAFPAP